MARIIVHTTRVFLGIGSNVGDRAATITSACESLSALLSSLRQASLYETRPRDVTDQPLFLNTVVSGATTLSAVDLLDRLQRLETHYGRDRASQRPKGPRTIDIDLLLYGDSQIELDNLIVPHPRMTERKFVLVPLVELAPSLKHPSTGIAFQSYLDSLSPQGIYYFQSKRYSRD